MRWLIMAVVGLMAVSGRAVEPLQQFSADQVMTVSGQQMNSRLYVDGTSLRTEMQMEGAGPVVSIVNGEKQTLWILMPGNMYLEKSVASDDDVSRRAWSGDASNREHLGQETINGQLCDKYRIKADKNSLFLFTHAKTGAPVLMTSSDNSVRIEWKNVKPGPQPASLFQLPAGYRKLAMPALPGLPGGFKFPGMK